MEKFRRKNLNCGCCGCDFYTWEEYIDQDQDKGFGICHECQEDAEERNNEILDKSVKLIIGALNSVNSEKLKAMPLEKQRYVAAKAHEKGMFTWEIGGKR